MLRKKSLNKVWIKEFKDKFYTSENKPYVNINAVKTSM